MSSVKPLFVHAHPGPSPWKVVILLNELGLPYTTKVYMTPELKQPEFLKINPNGMSPVLEDPNIDLVLAESGAIMDYLVEQYDKEHLISFSALKEKYLMKQWMQFQTTTQGVILQQILAWTRTPNPEARTYYLNRSLHVIKVLNDELANKEWLVGGRCSAADLCYVPFGSRLDFIMGADKPDMEKNYPNFDAWIKRMLGRDAVKATLAEQREALKKLAPPAPR